MQHIDPTTIANSVGLKTSFTIRFIKIKNINLHSGIEPLHIFLELFTICRTLVKFFSNYVDLLSKICWSFVEMLSISRIVVKDHRILSIISRIVALLSKFYRIVSIFSRIVFEILSISQFVVETLANYCRILEYFFEFFCRRFTDLLSKCWTVIELLAKICRIVIEL